MFLLRHRIQAKRYPIYQGSLYSGKPLNLRVRILSQDEGANNISRHSQHM